MTVAELIEHLQKQPQELQVARYCYSERVLMSASDIEIVEAGLPRPDGWIENWRPDKPTQRYLVFPD